MESSSNYTLLLVDDNKDFAKLISKLLEKSGYHVTTRNSGTDAKEYLHKNDCEMVITDMYMKDGNGIDLLDWINHFKSQCKVILMSGILNEERLAEIHHYEKKLGQFKTISKPFEISELVALIEKSRQQE